VHQVGHWLKKFINFFHRLHIRLSHTMQMWSRVQTFYMQIETGCLKQSVLTYESSEIR